MAWQPKPTNWRTRYWHRPPSKAWTASDHRAPHDLEREYLLWLAVKRGVNVQEARAHVGATQKPCGLISVTHNNATAWQPPDVPNAPKPRKPRAAPAPPTPASNVVPLVRVAAPTLARETDRRQAAAELLRDIATGYGPRRAHKLRAMADWLTAATATPITASAED